MGIQEIQQLRRLVPPRSVPGLVRRRLDALWADDAYRASQEAEMEFLLGRTERAAEAPALAYSYAEQMMVRAFMRWHPRTITRQRVRVVERLTRRDPARGAILSFTHHHRYDGMFGSVARLGAPSKIIVTPAITRPEAGIAFRQHLNVAARGGEIVPVEGGLKELADMLRPGVLMSLAPDFPGRTPVTFLGRRVLGALGTPRLAMMTDSPVILVTHRRDEAGPYVQVEEPIDPRDHTDPAALLDDILRRHGEAVLAWPEALESPQARFGRLPGEEPDENPGADPDENPGADPA
jgi:lauroyl/myristoyl acyltransferase